MYISYWEIIRHEMKISNFLIKSFQQSAFLLHSLVWHWEIWFVANTDIKMKSILKFSQKRPRRLSALANLHNSHISPISLILIVSFFCLQITLLPVITAQGYLSQCNATKPCLSEKFLTCQSGKCQCEDLLNQAFDEDLRTCVIRAGRNCRISDFESDSLLDPRKLTPIPDSPEPELLGILSPNCGSNAFCDFVASTCQCSKGYFHNESNGACDLSLGRRCRFVDDSIVFNHNPSPATNRNETSKMNTTGTEPHEVNWASCDSSLGLHCAIDGVCKCYENSVWQIDLGCVPLVVGQKDIGNLPNNYNTHSNFGEDGDGFTPFQRLVNDYTRALLASNENNLNPSYFPQTNTGTATSTWGGQAQNASNNLGNRNEFPGFIGGNNNKMQQQTPINNPLWNIWQQNQSSVNFDPSINNDIAQLQEQTAQLQKLLVQQQQLQYMINQLSAATNTILQEPQQQSDANAASTTTGNNLPAPSSLVSPQNNYIGSNSLSHVHPTSSHNNNNKNYFYPQQAPGQSPLYLQQQEYQHTPFGGVFSFFRTFRNFVEAFKRSLFPNLANAAYTLPSPVFLAASGVNSFLPILRAMDQQISPILQGIIQLTKPRPRPATPPPLIYNNFYPQPQHQHQQPWSGGSGTFALSNPQLHQPNFFHQQNVQQLQQRPFHSLLGNSIYGTGNAGQQQGRSLGSDRRDRSGRMRDHSRRLWWW